jgi:chaperone modulatory protein CbpM
MTIEHTEVLWLESRTDYSVDELIEMSGLPRALLEELIECGALPTAGRTTACFATESVVLARAASRLREHFELDEQGLAVAVSLLRRVRALESELSDARARAATGFD